MIAPRLNEPDVDEIPEHLRADLDFVFVDEIGEVFAAALEDDRPAAEVSRARPRSRRRAASPVRKAARPSNRR